MVALSSAGSSDHAPSAVGAVRIRGRSNSVGTALIHGDPKLIIPARGVALVLSIESIGQRRDFKILAIQNNYLLARVTSRAGYVSISPELEKELRTWLQFRAIGDAYHLSAQPAENDLLFPSEAGTPFRIGNYLKRVLKPIGKTAGVHGVTFQAMRRTFATHFQRYGSPKDAQTQLRHSKLEMTGWYMKQIPESVRAAVERMDAEISKPMEDHAVNEGGQIQ